MAPWNRYGGTDPATDVRAVFSWSTRLLSEDAASCFACWGCTPGPTSPYPRRRASLPRVSRGGPGHSWPSWPGAHLITEPGPGRYSLHDLLRTYAAEQVHAPGAGAARAAASHRILDHYLHTGYIAARLLKPERDPIDLAEPTPGTVAEDLTTSDGALAWFTAEHDVLLACVSASAAASRDRHVWAAPWTVKTYLFRGGYWHEQVATERAAADAARRDGDLRGRGRALFSRAEACERLNRLEEAGSPLRGSPGGLRGSR